MLINLEKCTWKHSAGGGGLVRTGGSVGDKPGDVWQNKPAAPASEWRFCRSGPGFHMNPFQNQENLCCPPAEHPDPKAPEGAALLSVAG